MIGDVAVPQPPTRLIAGSLVDQLIVAHVSPIRVSTSLITGAPGATWKLAITLRSAFITTDSGLTEPDLSPLQPVNACPGSGLAVSVTAVPDS